MLVTLVVCILCKCSKNKRKAHVGENMAMDENPVYQQYEIVGPNYERQYSTHEVVDNNDYYA